MKKLIPDLNGDILEAFSKSDLELFSLDDRQCLLAVLQENIRLVGFMNSVPKSNQEAQRNVFIQRFENLQKLDVLMTTISLIVLGLVTPREKKTIHRLCLSAQEHLKEFQNIVFVKSPLLTDRLKSKSKTISNDKMEQLLGLSN
jgi:hypothetical protein